MKQELLNLLDQKLSISLKDADDNVRNAIRAEWKAFGPAPNCVTPGFVQKKINKICHSGFTKREAIAEEVLKDLYEKHENLLDRKLTNKIETVLEKHFPPDMYVDLAEKTLEVFSRANSPTQRLDENVVKLEQAAIECGAANIARRTRHKLQQMTADYELQSRAKKKSFSSKIFGFIGNYMLLWPLKWGFGLLASLISIYVAYYLSKNG